MILSDRVKSFFNRTWVIKERIHMHFSVQPSDLLRGLQKIQTIVEKKNPIPILSNVLLRAQDQQLQVTATDMEVGIKVLLPAQCFKTGDITLPAKQILDITKELPDFPLTVELKENQWIELVCDKSKFNLVCTLGDKYPTMPSFEERAYQATNLESLKVMIDRTQFAASSDMTRFHLHGVHLHKINDSVFRMVATDGHRLSWVDQELFFKKTALERGMIIPKKGLSELRKLLDETESVQLAFETGYLFAQSEFSYLFVRLIDGDYPDYTPVIPKKVDQEVYLQRTALYSALKRVSLLANEKSRGVRLNLHPGTLILTSTHSQMGEAKEELEVQYEGQPIEIGFNSKYLLENLSVLKSEEIYLLFKDQRSPVILKEKEFNHHTSVIMPMQLEVNSDS